MQSMGHFTGALVSGDGKCYLRGIQTSARSVGDEARLRLAERRKVRMPRPARSRTHQRRHALVPLLLFVVCVLSQLACSGDDAPVAGPPPGIHVLKKPVGGPDPAANDVVCPSPADVP